MTDAAASQAAHVTYAQDIAPFVRTHCGACHRPGGPAPFSLLDYASVRRHGAQIADVIARRLMPPWKAAPSDPPFVGEQHLTSTEIATFAQWVSERMPEGDAARSATEDLTLGGPWRWGEPDLVLEATAPYSVRADGPDIFHLFVIPVSLHERRYVRGIEFAPGNRAVHHANILVDGTRRSRDFSAHDSEAESSGMIPASAQYPEGQILGWVPGPADPLLPPNLSWPLDPGTDLVIQVHLQPTGKPEVIRPRVALYFAETPPTETPALLRLGRQDFEIRAGDPSSRASDSFTLPVDASILAMKPHAHYRARSIRVRATLPNGRVRDLVAIDDWDMRWQQVYRYTSPVALPAGTTLTLNVIYDNSAENPRNPIEPPVDVRWGPRSTDEMGDCWIQLLPIKPDDFGILTREAERKRATMDVAGYVSLIAREPDNVALRHDLGVLYLGLGRPADALPQFDAAVQLGGDPAGEHFNLGLALAMLRRVDAAIGEYRESIRVNPNIASVHSSLGSALATQGDVAAARIEFETAIRLDPQSGRAWNNFGNLLLQTGAVDAALRNFQTAITLEPTLPDAHYNAGLVLEYRGELSAAFAQFQQASRLAPEAVNILAALAWIRATASDARLRDASEAMRLAARVVAIAGETPETLDLRSVALAAAGRFADALTDIRRAFSTSSQAPANAGRITREQHYLRNEPYREASGLPPAIR